VVTGSDSLRIGGLTPSTCYEFYVREICNRGDSSFWVGPTQFSTANGIPYFEDFENFAVGIFSNPWPFGWSSTTTNAPRWETEDASGANENSLNTGPFYDNTQFGVSGGMYVYLETSGTTNSIADLVTPPVFFGPNDSVIELSFYYHMYGATMGSLEVLLDDGTGQVSLTTITGQQQTAGSDPWIEEKATISGFQNRSIQLIFRGT